MSDQILNGTYTIVGPQGGHRTLRVGPANTEYFTGLRPGTRVVAAMVGPDNELSFRGIGFLNEDGTWSVWRRFADRIDLIKATKYLLLHGVGRETELGKAYAVISGKCFVCDKKLTTPTSNHYGYGPSCAKANGLPWDRKWRNEAGSGEARIGFQKVAPARTYEELFGETA